MTKLILPLLLLGMTADVKYVKTVDYVKVGGVRLLTLRGRTAEERADVITGRLPNLLSPNLKADDVVLEDHKYGKLVKVNGQLLVTLTPKDAKENKSSLNDFSASTLKHLKSVLPDITPVK